MNFWKLSQQKLKMQADFGEYGNKTAGLGRGRRWSGAILLVSGVLVGLGIYVLGMIYGPVAWVEAKYQVQALSEALGAEDRGVLGWVLPDLSYDLTAFEMGEVTGLVIPKIFIKEKVVLNVDPTLKEEYLPALKLGIAHAAGSSLPGDGGLGYYFAHSSGVGGVNAGFRAKFYLLSKLEIGDEVVMYREGEKYEYKVTEKRVTKADELSFLNQPDGKERVVLQTCWPIGTSAKRLVVIGERVGEQAAVVGQ